MVATPTEIVQDQAPDRIADGHPISLLRENPAMDLLTTNLDNLIQAFHLPNQASTLVFLALAVQDLEHQPCSRQFLAMGSHSRCMHSRLSPAVMAIWNLLSLQVGSNHRHPPQIYPPLLPPVPTH